MHKKLGLLGEDSKDENLIIDFNSETIQENILMDNSGNKNLGFIISDYILGFNEETYSPEYEENYDKILIDKETKKAY